LVCTSITPFHAQFAAAIHDISKGNGFVPHYASFERRQREEPHHHLSGGILSLAPTVEMRGC